MSDMGKNKNPDVSIIIPCYFEEDHLENNVLEIDRVMKNSIWSYEIIFVEDKSLDTTAEKVRKLVANNERRKAIFHEKNEGRGQAVTDGIRMAKGRVVGFIDIDLEVHARYIPDAISMIEDCGMDMIVGRRDYRLKLTPSHIFRHLMSSVYKNLSHSIIPMPVRDSEAGFKFFRREAIMPVLDLTKDKGWFWDTEIVERADRAGLKIGEVDCLFVRRADKKSTVKPFRDTLDYLIALYNFKKQI